MTSTGYSSIHDPVLWDGKGSALSLEGALIAPNALNFANIIRLPGRVYPFGWDEAMREAPENALAMRRDAFYRGLMQERTSKTINLEWQVVCENDGDPIQVMERDTMARCWRQTPDKIGLITWLLEAIWFGRSAQQGQWGKQEGGLTGWTFHEPVHGDSVQFAWDNVPVVLVSQYTAQKYQQLDPDAIVSATDRGSYGLRLYKPEYRNRFIIHKHVREAADYFEGEMSGGVHGVGLRSWCYWSGFMKRETMAWMTNFMQSTGMMDLLLFNYPDGNTQAKAKAEENAKKITGKIALLSPYNPALERKPAVEQIPMNAAGVQVLKELVETYYDRHIERLFVGQSMSAGGGASGGLEGSGRAEFAADTKSEIQLTDANRLGETLSQDWLRHAYRFNFPAGKSILRMEPVLDDPQAETKVQNFQILNSAGIAIEEDEVITAAGFRVPRPGRKLTKPQMPQADPGVQGGTPDEQDAEPPPVPGSPEDPHAVPSQEPMPEGLDPNMSYVDPDVMETAAVLLAVLKAAGLDDDAAELEGLMADPDAADDLAAYVSDNGEPMEQYQWHEIGEQYREIGEVWQGKSGRFFTRNRAGRTVPAKNPNVVEKPKRDPDQPTPQARAKTLAAGREPARQTARDVYAKARQAPHTLTHADVHGLAAHLDTLTRDELREHARTALQKVGGAKAELIKRLVGRIAGEKAAADVWGEMKPGERETGKEESPKAPPTPAKPPKAFNQLGESPLGKTAAEQIGTLQKAVMKSDTDELLSKHGAYPPGGTEDDPLGYRKQGFPPHVKYDDFLGDMKTALSSKAGRGANFDDLYKEIGPKHDMSKTDFARAMTAVSHDEAKPFHFVNMPPTRIEGHDPALATMLGRDTVYAVRDDRPHEPSPKATAAKPSVADTEAELRAEIEKDKTPNGKIEAERHAEVLPLLDRIRAMYTPAEIRELAHKVTGEKRGRNVDDWLHMLRADMTAVTRLVNSQNV